MLDGLKSGKRSTLKFIYTNYFPEVKKWILLNNGQHKDAEDVFHEALVKIIIGVDNIRTDFKSLLLCICKNYWLDQLRRKKLENNYKEHVEHKKNTVSIEEIITKAEQEQERFLLLENTLKKLSTLCQQLIKAIKSGQNLEYLTKELKMSSVNTLYRRKHACMKRWKELIQESKKLELV